MTRYRYGFLGEIFKLEDDIAYEYSFKNSEWVRTTGAADAFYEGDRSFEISYEEAMREIQREERRSEKMNPI